MYRILEVTASLVQIKVIPIQANYYKPDSYYPKNFSFYAAYKLYTQMTQTEMASLCLRIRLCCFAIAAASVTPVSPVLLHFLSRIAGVSLSSLTNSPGQVLLPGTRSL